MVKMTVKATLSWSMSPAKGVGVPSGLVRLSMSSDSMMVHAKF